MAVNILSLPTETLLDIFNRDVFSTMEDIAKLKPVCRRFHEIAEACKGLKYTFRVDTLTQPTWRFMRSLLLNPKLGEQISEINVIWERRDVLNYKTWTAVWPWTKEERLKLFELGEKWQLYDGNAKAAALGVNSEALLPILLCFTPNLVFLDLGMVEVWLFPVAMRYRGIDIRGLKGMIQFLKKYTCWNTGEDYSKTPLDPKIGIQDNTEYTQIEPSEPGVSIRGKLVQELESHHTPEPSGLWLHCNLNGHIPGLKNLKVFKHGCGGGGGRLIWTVAEAEVGITGDDVSQIELECLLPVFFLPSIEYIQLQSLTTGADINADDVQRRVAEIKKQYGRKSAVKQVELLDVIHWSWELSAVGEIADQLEYFYVEGNRMRLRFLEIEYRDARDICPKVLSNNRNLSKDDFIIFGRRFSDIETGLPAPASDLYHELEYY
ncbi:hypothetical protein TWF281_008941 [Arthrobotrys megalospora]